MFNAVSLISTISPCRSPTTTPMIPHSESRVNLASTLATVPVGEAWLGDVTAKAAIRPSAPSTVVGRAEAGGSRTSNSKLTCMGQGLQSTRGRAESERVAQMYCSREAAQNRLLAG